MAPPGHETRLGDDKDVVTAEIREALALGLDIAPVVVGNADIPTEKDLPPAIRDLARRNAVRVTHERFSHDMRWVVDAVYASLGLQPPTPFELFMEDLLNRAPFGYEVRLSSERTRDTAAALCLFSGAISLLFAALAVSDLSRQHKPVTPDLIGAYFLLGPVILFVGALGWNSARRGVWVRLGFGLATAGALLILGAFFTAHPY
jgi:hypothetical protein